MNFSRPGIVQHKSRGQEELRRSALREKRTLNGTRPICTKGGAENYSTGGSIVKSIREPAVLVG